MAEHRWFKVWGREVLASIDLNSLTDHEERVWWRLLAAASTEEPRWTIQVTPVLARFCVSTPARLRAAIDTFERRGMVRFEGGYITFVNAEKYQETPAAKRKREQRERDRNRDSDQGHQRDMSQDKRVTCHVTSHASVTSTRIAREAEAEAEADLAADAARRDTSRAAAAAASEMDLAVGRLCRAWEQATSTTVSRLVGDRMADWLERLPEQAIAQAIAETGVNGSRAWRYTEAILRRYETEGWDRSPPGANRSAERDYIPADEDPLNVALQYRRPVTSGGVE